MSRKEAELRNFAFALFDGRHIPDSSNGLWSRVQFDKPSASGPWLQLAAGTGRAALAPQIIAGRPAIWPDSDRHPLMAEALAPLVHLEPLFVALEDTLGVALIPTGLSVPPQFQLQLDLNTPQGRPVHRVSLAFEPDTFGKARRQANRPVAPNLKVHARLEMLGVRAPRQEIRLLRAGDIVLTPLVVGAPWVASLHLPGDAPACLGRFERGASQFRVETLVPHQRFSVVNAMTNEITQKPAVNARETPSPPVPGTPATDPNTPRRIASPPSPAANLNGEAAGVIDNLPMQLRIVLHDVTVPVGQIVNLGPGCVLDLGLHDDLRVQILAESTPIAIGRLVALGPGYGVLVEETVSA
jgi:flagellar motor switch/type III secretory pathway protein FliN